MYSRTSRGTAIKTMDVVFNMKVQLKCLKKRKWVQQYVSVLE
ncbi:hypothetical protein S1OALGB6SA_1304 [Olavius algarvensis spirochete endosymbiont]|nr:hypothetical protein S1OALGB6SA_1304 [Olavius algarvensis spirochete endosymbiont]